MNPIAPPLVAPYIQDVITVSQDVGGPYPLIKRVTLQLISDGTVRWTNLEQQ